MTRSIGWLGMVSALYAGCTAGVEHPAGDETLPVTMNDDVALPALASGSTWRIDPADSLSARATIKCPNAWGCDVLVSVALTGEGAESAIVPVEVLLSGERETDAAQLAVTQSRTAVVLRAAAALAGDPQVHAIAVEVLDAGALAAAPGVVLDARVAVQDPGFFGCGDACATCESSADCGGASCLEAGVCVDRAEALEPAPACDACRPLASGLADVEVSHRDELGGTGTHCYAIAVHDDPAHAGERFTAQIAALGDDDSDYELRLYRDPVACAESRPLAVAPALAHGRVGASLTWLEGEGDDTGTLLVQAIRRAGSASTAPYELEVSALD